MFKIGDIVKPNYKGIKAEWEEGIINALNPNCQTGFYYSVTKPHYMKNVNQWDHEWDLELVESEMMQYDPNQQGETDDDI